MWQKQGENMLSQGKYAVEIFEETRDDGLQIHVYADDDEFEAIW